MEKERMKEEAIKRLQKLNVLPAVINDFRDKDLVYWSEMNGGLFWLTPENEPDMLDVIEKVKDFEQEYDCLVYHVIHGPIIGMEMYVFLYVSQYEEEWEMDQEDLENGYAIAYVYNRSEPDFSEIGSVGIVNRAGGLIRTE